MIEEFEARLADLIADRLAGTTELTSIGRMRDGFPDAEGPSAAVMVLSADPDAELGDDRREVFGGRGERAERPVLRLGGEALVRLEVSAAASSAERAALLRALDRLLLELHDPAVRDGSAFDTGADLGFALDGGFRLARVTAGPDGAPALDHRRFDLRYRYAGRFWPVMPPLVGPAITSIPTRLALLPASIPKGLAARAGAPTLSIGVPLDLRALGGAVPELVARLQGAAPAGVLEGASDGLPPGFVRVPVLDGAARLAYVPPGALDARTVAGIELRYAGAGSAFPVLARFDVAVVPEEVAP